MSPHMYYLKQSSNVTFWEVTHGTWGTDGTANHLQDSQRNRPTL